MNKKLIVIMLAFCITFCLCACEKKEEDYISGTSFEPIEEYDSEELERYENKLHGIIMEYPNGFERLGNFDVDGSITFEGGNVVITVYVPDAENNDILTVEEYVEKILEFEGNDESGIIKYGKSTGYKIVTREAGRYTLDFIVKGVDAFYRFSYSCPESELEENSEQFQSVMASIRIDDGIYNKLTSMYSRYKVLLDYATSMQYITDCNYVSHCLNNFEVSDVEQDKTDALDTLAAMKEELAEIIGYERDEGDPYEDLWQKVRIDAEEVNSICKRAIEAVEKGDLAEAQRLVRSEIKYDLSESSGEFLSVLSAEIAEY